MWEQRWRLSCRATGRGVAQDRDDIKCHQKDSNAIEIFKYHWKETSRKISRRMSDLIDRVMTAKIHCPLLWLVRLINLWLSLKLSNRRWQACFFPMTTLPLYSSSHFVTTVVPFPWFCPGVQIRSLDPLTSFIFIFIHYLWGEGHLFPSVQHDRQNVIKKSPYYVNCCFMAVFDQINKWINK